MAPSQVFSTGATFGASNQSVYPSWSGSDIGTGLASYTLQQSVNGGSFVTIVLPTPLATSVTHIVNDGARYQFRVRATDKAGNVSSWATSVVLAPARIQDSSSAIVRGGTWSKNSNSNHSGGSSRYTSTAGRSLTLKTTMRDIAIVAPRHRAGGSVKVYVDGKYIATVSLRNSTTRYRQSVFARHFSSLGTHHQARGRGQRTG